MLRDPRADADYFRHKVDLLQGHAENADERLTRPTEYWRKPSARGAAADDALGDLWRLFSALYSSGASAEELRAAHERILSAAERALRLVQETMPPETIAIRFELGGAGSRDFYLEQLRLVSVAIAFDVDDDTFDRVVAALALGRGDRLIDRLIASRRPEEPVGEKLAFPGATKALAQAFDASDQVKAAECVDRYLTKWYRAWKGTEGWGGHEYQHMSHYSGYWAVEALGVVAALGLDDSTFRDNEFYPRDLARAV